ncbi:hypothetical protein ABEG17_08330 [Pedococcus sp. KACC 23699]|uniref:Uncharacterized protein n=1 Tax=Pedococcus sp. KACC 23699 TaxID=3149228 RepID=A0AAU7JYH4_9MICO
MDDTRHYLQAAQAQQADKFGAHWATFWLWCVTKGRAPLPASTRDMHTWLESLMSGEDNLETLHAAVLEITAAHEAVNLRPPVWRSARGHE